MTKDEVKTALQQADDDFLRAIYATASRVFDEHVEPFCRKWKLDFEVVTPPEFGYFLLFARDKYGKKVCPTRTPLAEDVSFGNEYLEVTDLFDEHIRGVGLGFYMPQCFYAEGETE